MLTLRQTRDESNLSFDSLNTSTHLIMTSSHSSLHIFFRRDPKSRDQFAQTPDSLLVHLEERFGKFDFDPCPVGPQFNGLEVEWGTRNYVNPPFDQLKSWLLKAIVEWRKGKEVVFLMPIRIHTRYFLDHVQPLIESGQVAMYVLQGGVAFKGYAQRAPFGVMYLHFPRDSGLLGPDSNPTQSSQTVATQ